jgi:hypothetical protein
LHGTQHSFCPQTAQEACGRARGPLSLGQAKKDAAMTANTRFDKSKLPSRHVTEGPARAPHRSYFYAMGITEEEITELLE